MKCAESGETQQKLDVNCAESGKHRGKLEVKCASYTMIKPVSYCFLSLEQALCMAQRAGFL